MEFFSELSFWHWLILAVVLLILETLAPGAIFIWMGIAAAVVGIVMLFVDLVWEAQFILFALLSLAAVVGWKIWRRNSPESTDQPMLNRRGEHYLNRVFTLSSPIVNGSGKIDVDDSSWRVSGADAPAGTAVRVIRVDGVVLVVEPEAAA